MHVVGSGFYTYFKGSMIVIGSICTIKFSLLGYTSDFYKKINLIFNLQVYDARDSFNKYVGKIATFSPERYVLNKKIIQRTFLLSFWYIAPKWYYSVKIGRNFIYFIFVRTVLFMFVYPIKYQPLLLCELCLN